MMITTTVSGDISEYVREGTLSDEFLYMTKKHYICEYMCDGVPVRVN